MKRALVALVVTPLLGLMAACSDETIVLAQIPDEDDAGPGPRRTYAKCSKNTDCAADHGEFCLIDHPDIQAGHCSPRPVFCDKKFDPVCAPSGISYLNDCYRKQAGETQSTEGECIDNPRICDMKTMFCPTGTTCELLGSGAPGEKLCGKTVGRCWGIVTCPPPDPDDHDGWDECSTEGGALRCVDTCHAVQSGQPFTHHARCR